MAGRDDYGLRLQKMVQYIEQDGHEKAEEIDVLTEEEFNKEKLSYMEARTEAVKKYYDNLEKKYEHQILLDMSKMKTQGHRDILATRHTVIDELFNTVQCRITNLTLEENVCLYKKVLCKLIIQGLLKIMEPEVVIEVRQKDITISKKLLKQVQDYFHGKTGMTINLLLSENSFLPENSNGGVVLYTKSKSIRLDNTLETKLTLVRNIILPSVRKALFGENPNRKHLD
ncbi:V-type proton ATPase subunit E 1-like isoform X2 [Homalodisca vitripennis]|uniref:V-type proton ATPase subunit E 1-like isoform X2 n=1 Tax=Homalodisca vitripennis TaxID=197043 RepID=UPI001EEA47DA|nr:V-type proton ATPase subunit E 1-like isoform X2 [Homalodisca vitripennis]